MPHNKVISLVSARPSRQQLVKATTEAYVRAKRAGDVILPYFHAALAALLIDTNRIDAETARDETP